MSGRDKNFEVPGPFLHRYWREFFFSKRDFFLQHEVRETIYSSKLIISKYLICSCLNMFTHHYVIVHEGGEGFMGYKNVYVYDKGKGVQ